MTILNWIYHFVTDPNPPDYSWLKWRLFIPFLSMRRRKWLAKRDTKKTEQKCKDAVAETLTSHQDILEAMYGKAPSIEEIYNKVKDKYQ